MATQQAPERPLEVYVESIDHWVDGGVGPAKPHENIEDGLADAGHLLRASVFGPRVTKGQQAIEQEERQPTADKNSQDDGQGLKQLGFFAQ